MLSSSEIKQKLFQEVDNILVFDKIKFQNFISNKQFLPNSFTKYKNKIGLFSNEQYLTDSQEVVLTWPWPYKDCILEGGQTKEDAKRQEVFWNETLAPDEIDRPLTPKVFTNFQTTDNDNINIVFSTIQGLHSRLNTPRENSLTYEDFQDQKIVLISDEAYHINVETKSGIQLSKEEKEAISSWENTVNKIFAANSQNVFLEFTATIDFNNPNISNKYAPKLIFDYW